MPKTTKKNTKQKEQSLTHTTEDAFATDDLFDDAIDQKSSHGATEKAHVVFEDSFSEQDERFADNLSAMYEGDGGKKEEVDMNTFDQKRKRGKMIAIACGVIFLLIGIGYSGYRIFHSVASDDDGGSVELVFSTPKEVASGEIVTLELHYTNNRTASLSGDIELFYPNGFLYQKSSSEPTNEEQTTFHVDPLDPGESDTISITGQLVGSTNAEKEFSALFTYTPENFSSNFQENATASITVTSSLIDLSVDAPEQVQSGEEFTYTATFENTSDSEMQGVSVRMIYPESFEAKESDPEFFEDDDEWFFETVSAQSSETIELTGVLSAESGSTQEMQLQVGFVEDDEFTLQAEETVGITVVNPEIEMSLEAPDVATAGSTVPVEVTVNNTSQATLEDINIALTASDDFFEEAENSVTIESLPAGEQTTVTAEMTIRENPSGDAREGTITATIPSAFVEGVTVEFPNEATATIALQGSFEASVDGGTPDEAGDVPTVDETSLYTIYWNIATEDTTIDGFRMATTLPIGVEWAGDASNGLVYDSATGEVSYEKETLPEGFEKQLAFTVSVTPDTEDVGKTLELTSDTSAVGIDAFTEQDISFSYPAVQTNKAVVRAVKKSGSNDLEN